MYIPLLYIHTITWRDIPYNKCQAMFEELKNILGLAPLLAFPSYLIARVSWKLMQVEKKLELHCHRDRMKITKYILLPLPVAIKCCQAQSATISLNWKPYGSVNYLPLSYLFVWTTDHHIDRGCSC